MLSKKLIGMGQLMVAVYMKDVFIFNLEPATELGIGNVAKFIMPAF